MKFRLPLAGWILLAMFLGVVIGYVIFLTSPDKAASKARSQSSERCHEAKAWPSLGARGTGSFGYGTAVK